MVRQALGVFRPCRTDERDETSHSALVAGVRLPLRFEVASNSALGMAATRIACLA